MNSKKTIQKILIGLLIAVALLVGYSVITGEDQQEASLSTDSLTSAFTQSSDDIDDVDVQLQNQEILRILGSIQSIELRDDIFSNPVFRDLRDTQFTIPNPINIGRSNPFLPIGFDQVAIDSFNESEQAQAQEEESEEEPVGLFEAGQEV